MAVAITRPVAGVSSTANTTSYAGTAFTPAPNSLLVVYVAASGTVAAATMTGGSLTWTRYIQRGFNTASVPVDTLYVFTAQVGSSPVSTTPTFDCTGDAATGCDISVLQVTGYYATAPVTYILQGVQAALGGSGANASVTFTTTATSSALVLGWAGQLGSASSTPPTSFTEADDIAFTVPACNLSTAYATGLAVTTTTFTNAACIWGAVGLEIQVDQAVPAKRLGLLGVG